MPRIALGQINTTVGDFAGNCRKVLEVARQAREAGADLVAFPELTVSGYLPEDLLLRSKFVSDNRSALDDLARRIDGIVVVAGFVDEEAGRLFNAAAVLCNGKIAGIYRKMRLPNYGVFDEARYFTPGSEAPVFEAAGMKFGLSICEDIWHDDGPTAAQAEQGAKLIININASPYHAGKIREREEIIIRRCREYGVAMAYVNLVGGQDELVFDGQSLAVDEKGNVMARADAFREDLLVLDLPSPPRIIKALDPDEEVYRALVLGLGDYVKKNGFRRVVMGLSGGIDSALVAALAVDALGKESVTGVFMPSRYTSRESYEDAAALAKNLGIPLLEIPVDEIFGLYLKTLVGPFAGAAPNSAEENLQARIRGNLLMALSNKFGWLVITTGNKSEMSVGYATLYGDMAGGFAVIKDVYKDVVYNAARYRNGLGPVIPERVFTKAPTAELKPDQKDTDTLPPYDILDRILKEYIEKDKSHEDIVALGFQAETVAKVIRLVDSNEYKRRQAPPGIKISPKAFGKDRRMPITNRYRG